MQKCIPTRGFFFFIPGLWGLVNNAGIQVLHAPLEFHSPEAIQKCISVNLLGVLEVTKAFLPLVRKSRGRLVFVSSAAGFQSFPCRAPYVITKMGLEALADCLRLEGLSGIGSHDQPD